MWKDPIVEEVHRARRQLLAQSNGDLRKAIAAAGRRQKSQGREVLVPAPRPPAVMAVKVSKQKSPAV